MANLDEFKRVMTILINNGLESMEQSGNLSIISTTRDGELLISVKDTGKGVPSAIQQFLCTPGFSFAKPDGNGFGLHYAKTRLAEWAS